MRGRLRADLRLLRRRRAVEPRRRRCMPWTCSRTASPRIAFLAGAGVEHDVAAGASEGRWPSAGPFRSRPRCAPRACSRRITSCRSACSAMPAPATPPRRILDRDLDCLARPRLGPQRARHHALDAARTTEGVMIHVNTDMDELTADGEPGHVVPGSCRAFLDLMARPRRRVAAGACRKARRAGGNWLAQDQGRAAAL